MFNFEEKPIFFIYQNGFRQISLPPEKENWKNPEIIKLTSCDDGVLVTTELPHKEVVEKMNRFIGRPILNVYCDSNHIVENDRPFNGARITKGNYGEEVISLDF